MPVILNLCVTCSYLCPVLSLSTLMCCFSVFFLQGEALGFSIWWGDEVHLCKVLWLSTTSEGEIFICIFSKSKGASLSLQFILFMVFFFFYLKKKKYSIPVDTCRYFSTAVITVWNGIIYLNFTFVREF